MTDAHGYRDRLQDQTKALHYATRFERGPRRRIDQREQRAVRRIFSALPDCRKVLDVPSGAGRFLDCLAAGNRDVIGMDTSAEILDFARERATRLGIKAQFLQGDAGNTLLPDGSVDVVFCNRLLHHITAAEERAVFLREFYRVTRAYVVVSFFDYQSYGGLRRLLKALKGRKVDYRGQPTLKEFCQEVTRCGFRVHGIVPTGGFWVSEKYFVLKKNTSPK
jgi:ubiquinone/menaquinone biosynthesis C-methylase UbiE